MTDGSKRLGGNDEAAKMTPCAAAAFRSELLPPPMPMSSAGDKTPVLAPRIALPHGVPSFERWGQTVVSLGKFKGAKTYAELAENADPDISSYKTYILPQPFQDRLPASA